MHSIDARMRPITTDVTSSVVCMYVCMYVGWDAIWGEGGWLMWDKATLYL